MTLGCFAGTPAPISNIPAFTSESPIYRLFTPSAFQFLKTVNVPFRLKSSISNDGSPVRLMDNPSKHATGYYANNTTPELTTGNCCCNCYPAEKQPIERVSKPDR
jgi:hypothetical protein